MNNIGLEELTLQHEQPIIQYSKYNPNLLGNKINSKKINISYNIIKFSIIILTIIFSLITLWFTTQWEKETLKNLGVDFTKFFVDISDERKKELEETKKIIDNLMEQDFFKQASSLGLLDWKTTNIMTNGLMKCAIAMSFIGIITVIPSLVFKKGTAFSIASLTLMFISLVIVIPIFFIGVNESNNVVWIHRSLTGSSSGNEIIKVFKEIILKTTGITI